MILFLQGSQAIRNGKEINIEEAPWTVGIWVYRENTTDVCTGSILTENFVVTAAQCVWTVAFDHINIQYGSSNLWSDPGKGIVYVKNVSFLRYRPDTLSNNIALLETQKPMMLDNVTAQAINLPDLEYDPMIDSMVYVSGFGGDKSFSEGHQLMAANFTVKDREKCEVSLQEFCAMGEGGAFLEKGDEGDPAVQNNRLVGVATYQPTRSTDLPAIFTKVGSFVIWIVSIIGPNRA
ncbi:Sar s 3 allergen (serine protease-like protein 16) [Sarcoptes scabiei]|uniref:Sar s 3 allergen (Serine protease-like protein 16) n=1 Tax=Sarcoptes scabiei TaxID=52283 RepID=A0A132AMC0_SARSC|nr:Sar s 3 allergen (serine protease-like protein 16) [Sarcoptes scabiei]